MEVVIVVAVAKLSLSMHDDGGKNKRDFAPPTGEKQEYELSLVVG